MVLVIPGDENAVGAVAMTGVLNDVDKTGVVPPDTVVPDSV